MPHDAAWLSLERAAAAALEWARTRSDLDPEEMHHRRGDYFTLRTGVSIGGGQTRPMAAKNSKVNDEILQELNAMECFQRIAAFSTSKL